MDRWGKAAAAAEGGNRGRAERTGPFGPHLVAGRGWRATRWLASLVAAAVLPFAAQAKTYTVNAVSSAVVNASGCDAGNSSSCTLGNAILALNMDRDTTGTARIEFDARLFSVPQTIAISQLTPY